MHVSLSAPLHSYHCYLLSFDFILQKCLHYSAYVNSCSLNHTNIYRVSRLNGSRRRYFFETVGYIKKYSKLKLYGFGSGGLIWCTNVFCGWILFVSLRSLHNELKNRSIVPTQEDVRLLAMKFSWIIKTFVHVQWGVSRREKIRNYVPRFRG